MSTVGALAGLLAVHAPPLTVLTVCAGLAVAAAVGMAAGDWLGGATRTQAAAIGAATLAGSLAPAVPVVAFPAPIGPCAALLVLAGIGAWISETRTATGRVRAYATTAAVLLAASILSVAVAVGLHAAG